MGIRVIVFIKKKKKTKQKSNQVYILLFFFFKRKRGFFEKQLENHDLRPRFRHGVWGGGGEQRAGLPLAVCPAEARSAPREEAKGGFSPAALALPNRCFFNQSGLRLFFSPLRLK